MIFHAQLLGVQCAVCHNSAQKLVFSVSMLLDCSVSTFKQRQKFAEPCIIGINSLAIGHYLLILKRKRFCAPVTCVLVLNFRFLVYYRLGESFVAFILSLALV